MTISLHVLVCTCLSDFIELPCLLYEFVIQLRPLHSLEFTVECFIKNTKYRFFHYLTHNVLYVEIE